MGGLRKIIKDLDKDDLCDDDTVLCLDCGSGYKNLPCDIMPCSYTQTLYQYQIPGFRSKLLIKEDVIS